jgi:hypothetical protein
MMEELENRYKQLIEKKKLTEDEKLELRKLTEQLFSGSPACRDLLKQYSVFDIATLFD